MSRPQTIFCDIDGTLLEHRTPSQLAIGKKPNILSGTREVIKQWEYAGANIILVTGRKESLRESTEKELASFGIVYDRLIMGLGGGDRIVINDCKPSGRPACWAVNVARDEGLNNYTHLNLVVEATKYFHLFGKKDIEALSDMFAKNVKLRDWDIDISGKNKVIEANKKIFDFASTLDIHVVNVSQISNKVYGEIVVKINGETIPVLDVITFNKEGKIGSIEAYKRK